MPVYYEFRFSSVFFSADKALVADSIILCFHSSYSLSSLLVSSSSVFGCFDDSDWSVRGKKTFGAVFSWESVECRKTKAETEQLKEITHIWRKQFNEPITIRTRSIYSRSTCSRRQARENACEQVIIGCGFYAACLSPKEVRVFFSPIINQGSTKYPPSTISFTLSRSP